MTESIDESRVRSVEQVEYGNSQGATKAKAGGRSGKQKRLRDIADDDKVSTSLIGEIKRDINEIKRGKRKNIRVPKGHELAHRRGKEARNAFGYEESDLQVIKNHRTQHKIDGYGKGRRK